LLGRDEIILNALPHHKTDALLRVDNLDRYDDRDDIRTNLIESFDRLMAFIAKHLPDKFYLEGVHSISLRNRLFREIVGNLIIHREFANRFPAKLIIEKDRVYTENWNRPHGWGLIDPLNFAPYPKNPVIAKFFREIGRADELGSGVRNLFKYGPEYTHGGIPELIEGDVFKASIPLRAIHVIGGELIANWAEVRNKVRNKFGIKLGANSEKILELILQNEQRSAADIAKTMKISPRAVEKQLSNLKRIGVIERIDSRKTGYWRIIFE
jgi:ATP-dependent DNA helicase RecG